MNRKTRTALEGSIEKWRKIVLGIGEDFGTENCPLCVEFFDEFDNRDGTRCAGCPVKAHTGLELCDSTPYEEFDREFRAEMYDRVGAKQFYDDEDDKRVPIGPKSMQAAIKEYEFLVSLLEDTK